MKSFIVTLVTLFAAACAFSQQPVKINLLEYFDRIPAPPASAKEGYEKCGCNIPDRKGDCNTDTLFKSLLKSLEKIQMEISIPPGSGQEDMAKKMQDPEFKKKMKKMSKEEKMKMAMEMQATYTPAGPAQPEPQEVLDVQREVSKLTEASAMESRDINTNAQADNKHRQELDAKHAAVDAWETTEIKKLPIVKSAGEGGSGPDPKAVHVVRVNASKKHLAIVDADLERTWKFWTDTRDKNKLKYTPYQSGMEKIHYGDDAKNRATKSALSSGQTLMMGALTNLIQGSKDAYADALKWYKPYVALQQARPQ